MLTNIFFFAENTVEGIGEVAKPEKSCNFSPHLSLETVFRHNLTKYEMKGNSKITNY